MMSIVKLSTFRDLQSKREAYGRALGTKMVLTIKYNTDGSIERYKARFVILGNRQVYGESYGETYAPVASMPSVRMFINFAAKKGLPMHQMDIMTAFLNAPMDYLVDVQLDSETVTVMKELAKELGMGDVSDETRKRIAKACYGLKQAPRQFYKNLSGFLKSIGFRGHPVEECLFKRHDKVRGNVWIIMFVDDLLIIGDKPEEVERFKQQLKEKYEIKDLGLAEKFLGIKITDTGYGIKLDQEHYTVSLLEKFGMDRSYPVETPAQENLSDKLYEAYYKAKENPEYVPPEFPVREAIGGLLFLEEMTRPDIANAVRELSGYMELPTDELIGGIKRVMRYLRGTTDKGLFFAKGGPGIMEGFVDSSYAGCRRTRKSITGYLVRVDGDVVDWKSKKQSVVAQSSSEAEYVALAMLVNKLRIARTVRKWLVGKENAYQVYEDNTACILMAEGEGLNKRTKHIDVRYHVSKEAIKNKEITLSYVGTNEQLADALTKNLGKIKFKRLMTDLILGERERVT